MAINAASIRIAITELLEGTIGTTRTVTSGVFTSGVHRTQPTLAQQSKALIAAQQVFDVELGPQLVHEASPMQMAGDRIEALEVLINVWRHLPEDIESDPGGAYTESYRLTAKSAMAAALDTACLALSWPGNLAQTAAAASTGIVSGRMEGLSSSRPERSAVRENRDTKLFEAEITGQVLLHLSP